MTEPGFADLSKKLDKLLENDALHIFDPEEVQTLQAIIEAWRAAEGFMTVTKKVGIVLALIVLIYTQGGRVLEIIRGAP